MVGVNLRAETLLEVARGASGAGWTERVELVEFYGTLQLCALQVVGPELPPAEIWISADCRDAHDLAQAVVAWGLARRGTAAQCEQLLHGCGAALMAWHRDAGDLASPSVARVSQA